MASEKTRKSIIDATMALAAERPWQSIGLDDIAKEAGIRLATLRGAYDGKAAIMRDFVARTDAKVLASVQAEPEDPARERVFDAVMARLDALAPHKPAIRRLVRAARTDPALALALAQAGMTSQRWMLAAAQVEASGGRALIREHGLALVMARIMRIWLNDDDEGLARTMAALDKELRRGERVLRFTDRLAAMRPRCRGRSSVTPSNGAVKGNGATPPAAETS